MNSLYHLQVAKAAFKPYVTPRGLDWIIRGNFNTDLYGAVGWIILLKGIKPLMPLARHWYKPIDHVDEQSSFHDITAMWNELRRRAFDVIDNAGYPPRNFKKMFITLGRTSHSLTDIYSHANYVELLYEYYRAEGAGDVVRSGLSLPEFIGRLAPTFTQVADAAEGGHSLFIEKYLKPKLFTDQCVPDEGPLSHKEINKDNPSSPRCNDQRYPDMFTQVMALAERDVKAIYEKFFEKLKSENYLKHYILTHALPGELQGPGFFERVAKFWSDLVGGWE
jgi:hypothetical protein